MTFRHFYRFYLDRHSLLNEIFLSFIDLESVSSTSSTLGKNEKVPSNNTETTSETSRKSKAGTYGTQNSASSRTLLAFLSILITSFGVQQFQKFLDKFISFGFLVAALEFSQNIPSYNAPGKTIITLSIHYNKVTGQVSP